MSDPSDCTVLLIHGSCHGAWCWDQVIAELQIRGIRAKAIDLPGRGKATTLVAQAEAIVAALGHDTLLVGHSAAGYPITAAAEIAPIPPLGLVYLCAYVPQPDRSLADLRRSGPAQPLKPALRLSSDRTTFHFAPEACTDLFYHDCPNPADAIARLVPEAVAPQETSLPKQPHALSLPRHYILCQDDRAIPPAYQAEMARGMLTTTLSCGHSPFLACPDQLAHSLAMIDQHIRQRAKGSR